MSHNQDVVNGALRRQSSESVALTPYKTYDAKTFSDLCWIALNGTLRKDLLKKFNLTRETFIKQLLGEMPRCEMCENPVRFKGNELDDFCSVKCKSLTAAAKQRRADGGKIGGLKRAGNTNAWSAESRAKREATKLERYGHKTGFCESAEVKRKTTLMQTYGTSNSFATPAGVESIKKQKQVEKESSVYNMMKLNDHFINVDWDGHAKPSTWECKRCSKHFSLDQTNPSVAIRCPNCDPVVGSLIQGRLRDKLEEFGLTVVYNTRKVIAPLELDLYIPEANVAVEVNGLYWHSFNRKETKEEREAGLTKWKRCKDLNITLLTFFEDELNAAMDLIVSMILSKCGKYTYRFFARNLSVKIIPSKDAEEFFNLNHLRGHVKSSLYLGLYDGPSLISAASFKKSRFERDKIELIRFATARHCQVVAGLSKLISNAKNILSTNTIITYADKCHSQGLSYSKISNGEIRDVPPGYYWWKMNSPNKKNRMHFQKHLLPKLLGDKFDPLKTEAENMFNSNYRRLWDCGHFYFEI